MTRKMRFLVGLLGALALVFLVGYVWQLIRAEGLESELETTQNELALARLEGTLGAAVIESQRGNYEVARRLTSDFFTGLQEEVGRGAIGGGGDIAGILARRDPAITFLSRGDPEATDLLQRAFVQYRVAAGGPDRAIPVPEGAPSPASPTPGPPGAAPAPTAGDTAR